MLNSNVKKKYFRWHKLKTFKLNLVLFFSQQLIFFCKFPTDEHLLKSIIYFSTSCFDGGFGFFSLNSQSPFQTKIWLYSSRKVSNSSFLGTPFKEFSQSLKETFRSSREKVFFWFREKFLWVSMEASFAKTNIFPIFKKFNVQVIKKAVTSFFFFFYNNGLYE